MFFQLSWRSFKKFCRIISKFLLYISVIDFFSYFLTFHWNFTELFCNSNFIFQRRLKKIQVTSLLTPILQFILQLFDNYSSFSLFFCRGKLALNDTESCWKINGCLIINYSLFNLWLIVNREKTKPKQVVHLTKYHDITLSK